MPNYLISEIEAKDKELRELRGKLEAQESNLSKPEEHPLASLAGCLSDHPLRDEYLIALGYDLKDFE